MQYYIKNKTDKPVVVEELGETIKAEGMSSQPYDDMTLRKIAGPRHDIVFVPVVSEEKKAPAAAKAESVSVETNEAATETQADETAKTRRRKL